MDDIQLMKLDTLIRVRELVGLGVKLSLTPRGVFALCKTKEDEIKIRRLHAQA